VKLVVGTAVALIAGAAPSIGTGQEGAARSVVIHTSDAQDGRLEAARLAVSFWNRTLGELGVPTRLREPEVVVASPVLRLLETYANRLSQVGWYSSPGAAGLDPPAQLTALPGEVIVLLSTERILSFAWPIGGGRYFLAIQTDRLNPLDDPAVARHVLAHEMGHTLGLLHNKNPDTLMCGTPCPTVGRAAGRTYLPLTEDDRARLLELHPRHTP
jgi:hypothetical protein